MNHEPKRVFSRAASTPTVSRLAVIAFACLALVALAAKAYLTARNVSRLGALDQADFNLFYYAFDTVAHHLPDIGKLYDRAYLLERLHALGTPIAPENDAFFGYPPQFAVLLSPLAALGLQAAKCLWVTISGVLLLVSLAMLTVLCVPKSSNRRVRFYLFALGLAALSAPLYAEIQFGQSNCLILFLVSSMLWLRYERGNSWLAGVPIGIAIIFKLSPAVILLPFLIRKDWRLVVSAGVVALAGTVATALVTGSGLLIRYLTEALPALTHQALGSGPAPWNSSFRGALSRVAADLSLSVPDALIGGLSSVYGLAVIALVAFVTWRSSPNRHRDMALATMLPLLVSPVVERHHVLLALVPILATAAVLGTRLAALNDRAGGSIVSRERHVLRVDMALLGLVVLAMTVNPIWISYYVAIVLLFVTVLRTGQAWAPIASLHTDTVSPAV